MKISRIIGYTFIIIGIFLYINDLISDREKIISEKNKINYTLDNQISYKYENIDLYDAIISIPKINLKRGIYRKDDKRNNINENIMIHEDSIYPTEENSNIILIAHSGTATNSYFKNLDKLDNDSLIEFYYNHTKYVYKIDTWYDVIKNGNVEIIKDESKKTITLITCNQIDKTKQTVYIGYLIDEVKY